MSQALFEDQASSDQAPMALARKWRPRQFGAVVGQDHAVRALQHALETGRLHHAYLLTGSRGVGKTTLARILAKALNCESGVVREPCGACGNCLAIDRGRFVDYIEIDAASNRGVSEIQQLLEQARFAPTAGRFKVYVIDEVHMLTGHAFNAMLKTLEEPPADVKFVLATTDPQKIPVTVLSRCLQFSLKNLRREALVAHLSHVLSLESVSADPEALAAIANAAQGSVRDALSLTDQAIAFGGGSLSSLSVSQMLGLVQRESLLALALLIAKSDAAGAMAQLDQLVESGGAADAILGDLARLFHEVSALLVLKGEALGQADPSLQALVGLMDGQSAQLAYQIVVLGRRDLGLAPDEKTGLEMTVLRLLAFQPEQVQAAAPAAKAAALRVSARAPITPPRPSAAEAPAASPPAVKPILKREDLTPANWPTHAKSLQATGLTRQFLQQSGFLGLDESRPHQLRFQVPVEALSESNLVARVTQLLCAALGETVSLSVTVGQTGEAPTAAAKAAARAEELQRRAELAIAESPLVQAIIREFDGTIVPGSIRWVGPDPDEPAASADASLPTTPSSPPNQESSS
jgi:DNA polymerase III subunit gamma/tau